MKNTEYKPVDKLEILDQICRDYSAGLISARQAITRVSIVVGITEPDEDGLALAREEFKNISEQEYEPWLYALASMIVSDE
jgi:hypothetical protein